MKGALHMNRPGFKRKKSHRESGISLIETMIAMVVLAVGMLSTMSLFSLAVAQNSDKGDRATRTTEYAQDKMEQLLALSFTDSASDTTVSPTAATGGTGLGGVMAGGTTVGSVPPAAEVSNYVDYLTANGVVQTTSTGAAYCRQWSITTNAGGNLKTITVVARALTATANQGAAPSTTLVSAKTDN